MDLVVGIDLGTSYSSVAIRKGDDVEVITNDQGDRSTPSYVAFNASEAFSGEAARSQAGTNPSNTIFHLKKLLGRSYEELHEEEIKHWPFKLKRDGSLRVELGWKDNKEPSPEEVLSHLFKKLRETASSYLGKPVTNAVVSVPASWSNVPRQSLLHAAKLAGLRVLQLIKEPIAVAVAYGLDLPPPSQEGKKVVPKAFLQNVLVIDIGGGSTDVSLLKVNNGLIQLSASVNDRHVGGETFDHRLLEHFRLEFQRKHKHDLSKDSPAAWSRMRIACERIKKTLSSTAQASVELETLYEGIDYTLSITRARFELLCQKDFQRIVTLVKNIIKKGESDEINVDQVLLVGGASRIPKIQALLSSEGILKEKDKARLGNVSVEDAVVIGAAIQASLFRPSQTVAVALPYPKVVPLSIGIETYTGVLRPLVPIHTPIPTQVSHIFSLSTLSSSSGSKNLSTVIKIYQGQRLFASDNLLLAEIPVKIESEVKDIEAVKISVTLEIDSQGILKVTVIDLGGGGKKKFQPIVVEVTPKEQESKSKSAEEKKLEIEKLRDVSVSERERDEMLLSLLTERLDLNQTMANVIKESKDKSKLSLAKDTSSWLDINISLTNFPQSLSEKSKSNISELLQTLRTKAKQFETIPGKEVKKGDEESGDDEKEVEEADEEEGEKEGEEEDDEEEGEPDSTETATADLD